MANINEIHEFSQLLGQTQGSNRHVRGPRQMHKVQREIRRQKEHLYEPVMVSLGPYHHGKEELRQAEGFKYICLDWCSGKVVERKLYLYKKVLEKIDEIRSCYAEVEIVNQYNDKALALMMLLDACFIINFMENRIADNDGTNNNFGDWVECFGLASSISFADGDIMLLENQVPYSVIKLLMSLFYDDAEKRKRMLAGFFDWSRRDKPFVFPGEDAEPPIHLLEAYWRVFQIQNEQNIAPANVDVKPLTTPGGIYKNYSAMNLKANDVFFCPSSSGSLKHITFNTHGIFGSLYLPNKDISQLTPIIFSNLIAYEVSPNTKTEPIILSYINLMKSLIQTPEDAKELQEKGILFNMLDNDEQVVQAFKEINTFGLATVDSFKDVKSAIEEHCSSIWRRMIISFRNYYFRYFVTGVILYLTFVQTLATIGSSNSKK